MFKINFQIEDLAKLRSWLTEPDFDPALHLNGFIDITYREYNFLLNYLQTPMNGRIPFESKMKYLIVNIVNDLINFLAESDKPRLYELGDLPNIYKLVLVNLEQNKGKLNKNMLEVQYETIYFRHIYHLNFLYLSFTIKGSNLPLQYGLGTN